MSLRQARKLLPQLKTADLDSSDSDFQEAYTSRNKFSFANYCSSSPSSASSAESSEDDSSPSVESGQNFFPAIPEVDKSAQKVICSPRIFPRPPLISDANINEDAGDNESFDGNATFTPDCKKSLFQMDKKDFSLKSEMDRILKNSRDQKSRRGNFVSKLYWLIPEPIAPSVLKPARGNIRMTCYDDKARKGVNGVLFKLEPSKEYTDMLTLLKDAVDAQDINLLADLLKQSPLHAYGLLKFVDIYNLQNDKEEAFRTLKLTLQVFQQSFHKDFNPFTLDSSGHPMVLMNTDLYNNRVLLLALLEYMLYCEKRVCYRTALTLCRLLIAIDIRHDKAHALLHLDHYFIVLKDVHSLLNFSFNFDKHRARVLGIPDLARGDGTAALPLHLFLPNFAFSLPLILNTGANFKALELTNPSNTSLAFSGDLEALCCLLCSDLSAQRSKPMCLNGLDLAELEWEKIAGYGDLAPKAYLTRALLLFPQFCTELADTLRARSIGDKKLVCRLEAFASTLSPSSVLDRRTSSWIKLRCRCTAVKNAEIWSSSVILSWLVETCEWLSEACQQNGQLCEYQRLYMCRCSEQLREALRQGELYDNIDISPAEFAHPHIQPSSLSL